MEINYHLLQSHKESVCPGGNNYGIPVALAAVFCTQILSTQELLSSPYYCQLSFGTAAEGKLADILHVL